LLLTDVFRYLKSRVSSEKVVLWNKVDFGSHHSGRTSEPSVAIIIPTRDRPDLLMSCVESIFSRTTYPNFEIIIIDNGSKEEKALIYLEGLISRGVTVVREPSKFNFSELCNLGATKTSADYFCFMNNDTEVIESRWLDLLVDHAIYDNSGVIGSKLLYKSGKIQHLGLAFGFRGIAGHAYLGVNPDSIPKISSACFQVSGVTFACALISAEKYRLLGGLDARFRVGLNDVDFSKRSLDQGFNNIICSRSCLTHLESQSRHTVFSLRGAIRATSEVLRFLTMYGVPRENFYSQGPGSYSEL
jgi:O-antigen biosynthesis protein